ncbi:MAG: hypothetical protein IJW31_03850 [Lentisphaeria bacterium]|nr:hypothetical protein [Lentisphaeria bacterium]
MNYIFMDVLAIILNLSSGREFESKKIPFEKLPIECVEVYDKDIREWRNEDSTEVIEIDLDDDQIAELLIFNGQNGSGGEGYTVMQKHNGKYRKVGEVFGCLYQNGKGLIVELPLTPHHAEWSYYELINGKLDKQLQFHVEYAQAVREKVETIIIKIQK